jgi:hypothetical protein
LSKQLNSTAGLVAAALQVEHLCAPAFAIDQLPLAIRDAMWLEASCRGAGGQVMTHLRVQKSIYWIMQWGWRGPAIVILAVFLLWLYYLLAENF